MASLEDFFKWVTGSTEGQTWAQNQANPQQSLGGPVVSEGNKWGIGANGGIVWNGTGPAPEDAVAQKQLEELFRGSIAARGSYVRQPDGSYVGTGASTYSPKPQASGPAQPAGSGAQTSPTVPAAQPSPTAPTAQTNDQLKAFLEYIAGRAGNASPVVGQAPQQAQHPLTPLGRPNYGTVVQKGLL